jgi:DNA (cytosine-5)-methyltransferase 1
MLGEKSFTLATNNDQTLFVFYGNRVDDVRIQDSVINTLQARMRTGGNNMPMIFSHTQGLDPQPSEEVSPTLRRNGNGMAVAYDEFNDSISDTHHTLRAGTKQSTGVMMETQVRRLTPLECERLQGFPDDWTASQSDSARYKQMGNAVAVPVVEWIIQGIVDTLI